MTKARLALLAVLLGSGAALAVKPDKPGCVSSNDNEEGRAKNRRVELVKQ